MKRLTTIACALLLFSGAASAASPLQGGLLGELLGPQGVVASLVGSLKQGSLQPTFDALAARHPAVNAPLSKYGKTPLAQGPAAQDLNLLLSALLTNNTGHFLDLKTAGNALTGLLLKGPQGGALRALVGALTGSGQLLSQFGGGFGGGLLGASLLTGTGQGMSPKAIPLNDLAPATRTALINGVTLPGI